MINLRFVFSFAIKHPVPHFSPCVPNGTQNLFAEWLPTNRPYGTMFHQTIIDVIDTTFDAVWATDNALR
jgi:hypothetical protein